MKGNVRVALQKVSLRQLSESIPAPHHHSAGRLDGCFKAGPTCRDLRWLPPHESSLTVRQQLKFDFISRSNTKVLQEIFRQGDPPARSDCHCPHTYHPLNPDRSSVLKLPWLSEIRLKAQSTGPADRVLLCSLDYPPAREALDNIACHLI